MVRLCFNPLRKVVDNRVLIAEQGIVRCQFLAHLAYFAPTGLVRIGHIRIHLFGTRLEFRGSALRVVQAQQLQMGICIARIRLDLGDQFLLFGIIVPGNDCGTGQR